MKGPEGEKSAFRICLALLFVIGVCGAVLYTVKGNVADKSVSLAENFDGLLADFPEFSGVILVADKGVPVYHRAFGFRDFTNSKPMRPDSIFELASLSKQFTAMTVMLLMEDGLLEADGLLEQYLPNIPYPGITIRHLLNHTSGLPDYQGLMEQYWDKSKVADNGDIMAYLAQYKPPRLFAPGEKYKYSNTGYVLLASIVEVVSGQDFTDFIRARIFKPLQMTDTDIRSPGDWDMIDRFALGYKIDEESGKYIRAVDLSGQGYTVWLGGRYGPGRVSSTTEDILKWDRALYTDKLVGARVRQMAFTPGHLNDGAAHDYGFGWHIKTDADFGKFMTHSGGNPGYATRIFRFVEADMTVIILNNNGRAQETATLSKDIVSMIRSFRF